MEGVVEVREMAVDGNVITRKKERSPQTVLCSSSASSRMPRVKKARRAAVLVVSGRVKEFALDAFSSGQETLRHQRTLRHIECT